MSNSKHTTVVFKHEPDSLAIKGMLQCFSENEGKYADARIIEIKEREERTSTGVEKFIASLVALFIVIIILFSIITDNYTLLDPASYELTKTMLTTLNIPINGDSGFDILIRILLTIIFFNIGLFVTVFMLSVMFAFKERFFKFREPKHNPNH